MVAIANVRFLPLLSFACYSCGSWRWRVDFLTGTVLVFFALDENYTGVISIGAAAYTAFLQKLEIVDDSDIIQSDFRVPLEVVASQALLDA